MKKLLALILIFACVMTLSATPNVIATGRTATSIQGLSAFGQLYDVRFVYGGPIAYQSSTPFVGAGHWHEATATINAALTAGGITAVSDGVTTTAAYSITEAVGSPVLLIDESTVRQDERWYAFYRSYWQGNRMWATLTPHVERSQADTLTVVALAVWWMVTGGAR